MEATSGTTTLRKFGAVTGLEKVHLGLTFLRLPFVLLWNVLNKPVISRNRNQSLTRIMADATVRVITRAFNRVQMQSLTGPSSRHIYEKWVKANGIPSIIEDIGENAQLMWIGPKRTDKVILVFHGGAFLYPISEGGLSFWKYIQDQLKDQDVGLVILLYTLVPNGLFPTQLKQGCKAIEHLLSSGVTPENLQLAGDSAGGNLITQILSHILHPLDDVPLLQLSNPIQGALLISPWARILTPIGNKFDGIDTIYSPRGREWGEDVAFGVPDSKMMYLESATVSETWFKGVEAVVSRVLITAGGVEVLKDDIEQFHGIFSKHHGMTEFVIQKDGIHDDPIHDFAFPDKVNPVVGELTPIIVGWLRDGFRE